MFAATTFALTLSLAGGLQRSPDPVGIVGGSAVEACGWPTTVYTGGCTATLVHPKAISTAQHCGSPSSIQFGTEAGVGPTVAVTSCVGDAGGDGGGCRVPTDPTPRGALLWLAIACGLRRRR